MDVTISIINYNYGRFLRQAIESALAQSVHNARIEVLVVDDGSTDESDLVIAEFAGHQRFRSSKTENRGFGSSLSRAISEAAGDYVFLLDADDYYTPNKVATVLPHLKNGVFYVCDLASFINEEGAHFTGSGWGNTSTVAINRSVAIDLLPVENELSFMVFFYLGRGKVLQETCTRYRVHEKSMTNRNIPGKWNSYLAGITHNLANYLFLLLNTRPPPRWLSDRRHALSVVHLFRARAYYNELEANLELHHVFKSAKSCFFMVYWQLRSSECLQSLHYKMIIKTIIQRPSFPKS